MKKRFFILLAVFCLAVGLAATMTACGDATQKVEYSVTVLSPDPDNAPVAGATVSWKSGKKVAGTAITDENGKATATLKAGTYTVTLSDIGAYSHDVPTVTAKMRDVTVILSDKRINYAVRVTDKAGIPAANIGVAWVSGTTLAGTATTDAQGFALCELIEGTYEVALSSLPAGNTYNGAITVNSGNAELSIALRDGATDAYSVTVRSEGKLLFKNQAVFLTANDTIFLIGKTNEQGVYEFNAPAKTYNVTTTGFVAGYRYDPVTVSQSEREKELVLVSEVIQSPPAANTDYVMGDIIHNYSFETPYALNGAPWKRTVSEILSKKDALIINNWGTQCSWCVTEMPAMDEAYRKYAKQIEMVAVSNYMGGDSDATIRNYAASHDYAFPLLRDRNGFDAKFRISGWPTTVVIDRYGAVARIESGAITSVEAWERLIQKYIGDEYVQTFEPGERESESINNEISKPDIVLPDNHYDTVAAEINNGVDVRWSGEEDESQYAWPYLIDTVENVSPDEKVLYASNTKKANSWAVLYASFTLPAGKVFTFDYYADTEKDNDELHIVWDRRVVRTISGNSDGWQTCYLYGELVNGDHNLAFVYRKDGSKDRGLDNVYLRNVRFVDVADIDETDMLRSAAYGDIDASGRRFEYYAGVQKSESDGYYRVDFTTLQNNRYAGDAQNTLLLADLTNSTPWSASSVAQWATNKGEDGEYTVDCTFTIDGKTRDYRNDLFSYCSTASASDIEGCVPVDDFLRKLLTAFTASVSGGDTHANEWLEVCYFHSRYGTTEDIQNPIMGLRRETAIPVQADTTYTANLTRNQYPFPTLIYSFTPDKSAVYKIESLIPEEKSKSEAAQVWLYDDDTSPEKPLASCGDEHLTRDGVNEHNFSVYRYLQAGHKYYIEVAFQMAGAGTFDFEIAMLGDSATRFVPCSGDYYTSLLDEDGNMSDQYILAGAVEYVKDDDGYYHAKNPDGSMGDFIYMDTLYPSGAIFGTVPLYKLYNMAVPDPETYTDLNYTMFDFRYCVTYHTVYYDDGTYMTTYRPQVSLRDWGDRYVNCTDAIKAYIDKAPTSGEYKGFVKVDDKLIGILNLFIELRFNPVFDEKIEPALENEWLRFCWYKRTYNEANP